VVGFTIGSRGKVPGKTCEKRIRRNNNIIIALWYDSLGGLIILDSRRIRHWF
jgi:hypothetical protein